jgi:hypothetical protein
MRHVRANASMLPARKPDTARIARSLRSPVVTIVPDTKNWTWVLERPCPDCGFDASMVEPASVPEALRANAREWTVLLAHPAVRVRPRPDQWSALEYGCHVRDVFRLFDDRLRLMLDQDDARFANWDQDETAIADRYAEQDPETVLRDLQTAAEVLAARFDGVHGDQWERTGTRSDGARFSIAAFSRYLLHDPVHHVYDVEAGYAILPPPSLPSPA